MKQKNEIGHRARVAVLNTMARGGFTGTMVFEQRAEGGKSYAGI